jgi:hypothetical protein
MAHHQGEVEAGKTASVRRQGLGFSGINAKAGHSGIDVEGGRRTRSRLPKLRPSVDLFDAVEDRDQAMFSEDLFGTGHESVEDMDGSIGYDFPERDAFLDLGDEKRFATGSGQGWSNPLNT